MTAHAADSAPAAPRATISATRRLAELAVQSNWADLSERPKTIAVQALVDWLAVAIAGTGDPATKLLASTLIAQGIEGNSTAIGLCRRLPSVSAALFNGMASHVLDYDDVNFAVPGHAAAPVWAAALAVAEERRCSGIELLQAFAAGYDVCCRIGLLVSPSHYARGFHATATMGTFGATAAVGRLLGLDATGMARAFGLAASRAAGLKAMFGTSGKPMQVGNAASAGVLSAVLAAGGMDAPEDVLEHRLGFTATHSADFRPEAALGPPVWVRDFALPPPPATSCAGAAKHHLEFNLFKFHATCYETHAAIECALRLRAHVTNSVERVKTLQVRVNPHCADICNIANPRNAAEIRFSIRVGVALGLLGMPTGQPALFTDLLATDPEVLAVRDRTSVILDPEVGVPVARLAAILSDGTPWEVESDTSIPTTDLAEQQARLEAKFFLLTRPVVGHRRAEKILCRALEMPHGAAVSTLMEAVA